MRSLFLLACVCVVVGGGGHKVWYRDLERETLFEFLSNFGMVKNKCILSRFKVKFHLFLSSKQPEIILMLFINT